MRRADHTEQHRRAAHDDLWNERCAACQAQPNQAQTPESRMPAHSLQSSISWGVARTEVYWAAGPVSSRVSNWCRPRRRPGLLLLLRVFRLTRIRQLQCWYKLREAHHSEQRAREAEGKQHAWWLEYRPSCTPVLEEAVPNGAACGCAEGVVHGVIVAVADAVDYFRSIVR